MFTMRSLMLSCVLVLLTSALVGGLGDREVPDDHKHPSYHLHNDDDKGNDDSHSDHRGRHSEFPHDAYSQIPDGILGDVLCVIFTKFPHNVVDDIHERYGSSKSMEVSSSVRRLMQSDFLKHLVRLRNQVFSDMSRSGKAKLCYLLQHMPETYTTCGFEHLIKLMADQCTMTTNARTLSCDDMSNIHSFARTTRIVGGFAAQQGLFDSFASINVGFIIRPICGAVIVDSCTVLTAAHCVRDLSAGLITVNVGDHTRIQTTTQLRVYRIYIHEDNNPLTQANDVAILKVGPIDFNAIPNTAPACLATPDVPLKGKYCTAVGVGTTSHGGQAPTNFRLRQVSTPTWDGIACYQDSSFFVTLTDPRNQICSGERGKNSCQGDSGGPLFCQHHGRQVVTGLVSYGVDCGLPHFPGIYTKVSSYLGWIAAHSGC